MVMLGRLNPFEGDLFFRWMILGASWLAAVFLGAPLWRRLPIPGTALGAAVLAVLINLLAAGGIGIPTVALGLWSMLAIGLNLREDRPCGRLREYESRVPPFVLAVGWAALLGTFVGVVSPFWRSEYFIAQADEAIRHLPPDFDRADEAYRNAIAADRFSARPWRESAHLHLMVWQQSGGKIDDQDKRWSWKTIPILYEGAAQPPRNPNAWGVHSERAAGHSPDAGNDRLGAQAARGDTTARRDGQIDSHGHATQSDERRAARSPRRRERGDQHVSGRRRRGHGSLAPRPADTASRQEATREGSQTSRGPDPDMERKCRQDADPGCSLITNAI